MQVKEIRLLTIIINYKTPELVCDALASLKKAITPDIDKVVVVDNNSMDNSLVVISDYIEKNNYSHWVHIIPSENNAGFSAGNNIGIKYIDAKYYLLLNSDAFVRDGAIKILLETAEINPSLGIVGPALEWPDGTQQVSCFYNLSPTNSFLHSIKLGAFTRFFKMFGVNEVVIPVEQHNSVQPDWLSFACVLLNGKMIREIGLMDEGYFMYREDNDYCRRAVDAGWQLKYESKARVVHLNKGSSNQSGVKRLPEYYFNSRARYFKKYYGHLGLLTANVLWSLGRAISRIREIFTQTPKAFHSSMWGDIWTGFFTKQE